jgi:DNA repair protein RecO (recombination protein O)
MSHEKVKGFVLRTVPYGEHDRIVDILTKESGLITASARGARRTRSQMLAATQEFALSEFELFSQNGHLYINSADLVESFIELQSDLPRLVCAAHLSELFLDCLRDDAQQQELYTLWAYTVNAIISPAKDPLLTAHVCGLRLMKIAGYEPRLDHCVLCAQPVLPVWFSFNDCGLVCSRHLNEERSRSAIRITDGLLSLLQHVLMAPVERLYAFTVDPSVSAAFIELSLRYVRERMEKQYTRLDLLNTTMEDYVTP